MEHKPFTVTHLTIYRDLPAGIRKQLRFEASAASSLSGVQWNTIAAHGGDLREPFERAIPRWFRFPLLRYLYGWILARRLSKSADVLLLRHMPFDPFAFLLARLIPNRVSVHHSKEIEELPLIRPGLVGNAAALLERWAGRHAVRQTIGVLGVTGDIADYQCTARVLDKPTATYSNGVNLDTVHEVDDQRDAQHINVVFMCETFSLWHGLDRLIAAVAEAPHIGANGWTDLTIHLIGNLPETLATQINALGDAGRVFKIHGFMGQAEYLEVLSRADVGLGSLALDRQNMIEGSTLKVREMLAMGLPVWANHKDTALPETFRYYCNAKKINLADIQHFGISMKPISRTKIRGASAEFVSKIGVMRTIMPWLRDLVGRTGSGNMGHPSVVAAHEKSGGGTAANATKNQDILS